MNQSSSRVAEDNVGIVVYNCIQEAVARLGYKLVDDGWQTSVWQLAVQRALTSPDFDCRTSGALTDECGRMVRNVAKAVILNNLERRAWRRWEAHRTTELLEELTGDPTPEITDESWTDAARSAVRCIVGHGVDVNTAVAHVLAKAGLPRQAICDWLRENQGVELRVNTLNQRFKRLKPLLDSIRPELKELFS